MKNYWTKIFVLFTMIGCFISTSYGQTNAYQKTPYKIKSANIGLGGSSKTVQTSNGKYVISQSIGQSSVIGTSTANGYYLRQGFQQPHKKIQLVKRSGFNSLKAAVYPNPFEYVIYMSFNETLSKHIDVEVYDVAGKLLYFKKFQPSQKLQVDLTHLSSGSYILKAISNGKIFNSKLIKI